MRWSAEKALEHWRQQGLLTDAQVAELRASLGEGDSGRAVWIFAVIGAVLSGLGVLLFVGSNWSHLSPVARCAILFSGYLLAVAGASFARRRDLPKVAEAAWLLVTALLGANVFLLAQIFNHSLTYWQGPFVWMVGALALGWALHSRVQAAVAVPLGLLALGWLGGGAGWFFDDQMQFLFDSGGLRPILPHLGIGLVGLALMARRVPAWSFASGPLFGWGSSLIAVPLVVSTAGVGVPEWLYELDVTPKQIFVLVAGAAAVGAAAATRRAFRHPSGRGLLLAVGIFSFSLLVPVEGRPWITRLDGAELLFVGYVLGVFALSLATIWVGVRAEDPRLVNVGMFSTAVLVVIQYFSWSFRLLDRSLVFIFGGLLLLALSIVLERQRRSLLSGMGTDSGTSTRSPQSPDAGPTAPEET